jgi:hypothetical protein
VHPDDAFSKLLLGGSEHLNVAILFGGGSTSKQGQARARLLDHLACDEQELRDALSRLRVRDRANLERMQTSLDYRLESHNFVPVGESKLNRYDELARKIIQDGPNVFNANELRTLLDSVGLMDRDAAGRPAPWRVGVRSFERQAVYLDEEMDELLDLLGLFDGRFLSDGYTWNEDVGPRVREFMMRIDDQRRDDVELHLHCKLSIAYGAGAAVSRKSATRYSFRQPGHRGTEIWRVSEGGGGNPEETWSVKDVVLRQDAPDVAVAVAVSNGSGGDARLYVERNLEAVGRLIVLEPVDGVGQRAVRDGAHASDMGETDTGRAQAHAARPSLRAGRGCFHDGPRRQPSGPNTTVRVRAGAQ